MTTQATFSMKSVAPTAGKILALPAPAAAGADPVAAIAADLAGARRLVILVPDALGILPWRLWRDRMPFLSSLHEKRSILLESVMPSVTPVNFACMLTGAELAVHGVEVRTMDFRCETLFDVVRRNGGRSAGGGNRGASGELLLARCADYPWVAEGVIAALLQMLEKDPGPNGTGPAEIVNRMVLERFATDAPVFTIVQYAHVDSAFHKLGPSNPLVAPVLEEFDRSLERTVARLSKAGADIMILADHGQHDNPDPAAGGKPGQHGSDIPEDRLVPCTWVGRSG